MNTPRKNLLWTKPVNAILGLSFLIPFAAAEAHIPFKAPVGLGVPGRRIAAGSRSMENKEHQCVANDARVVAMVPQSNMVLTTAKNPVLFFYVPQTSAPQLELVVQDKENSQKFVKQFYKPSSQAGVVKIPITATSLAAGKEYRWFFSIICNPKERSKDQEVEGSIQRINPDSQLLTKLNSATPNERVKFYAEAGYWADTTASLAQLISDHPNEQNLKDDWKELLSAQGVDKLLSAQGVNLDKVATGVVNEPRVLEQEALRFN